MSSFNPQLSQIFVKNQCRDLSIQTKQTIRAQKHGINCQKNVYQYLNSPSTAILSPSIIYEQSSQQNSCISRRNSQKSQIQRDAQMSICHQRIKFEQSCFKFKLKVCSILRNIDSEDGNIEKLQKKSPDQFIEECQSRIKMYIKNMNKKLKVNEEKIKSLNKLIQNKQAQIFRLNIQVLDKQKCLKKLKQRNRKQMETLFSIIKMKEDQNKQYQQRILKNQASLVETSHLKKQKNINQSLVSSISFKNHASINRISTSTSIDEKIKIISPNKADKCLSFSTKSMKILSKNQNYIKKQDHQNKMKILIEQWRNILYSTVDYYEDKLKSSQFKP